MISFAAPDPFKLTLQNATAFAPPIRTRAKVAACGRNPHLFAGSQPGALLQSA